MRLLILGWSLKQIGQFAVGTGDVVAGVTSACSVSDSPNLSDS